MATCQETEKDMRLRFFIVFNLLLLIGTALPVAAQKEIQALEQGLRVPEQVGNALERAIRQVPAAGTQLELSFPEESLPVQVPTTTSSSVQNPAVEVPAVLATDISIPVSGKIQPSDLPKAPGVFQARDLSSAAGQYTFSGTVFRDGDGTYGVIAAHVLGGLDRDPNQLGRVFVADIYYNGGFRSIVADAVFISPAFDLALVEFKPQDADLLDALELDTQLPQEGDFVSSQGFIRDRESIMLARRVTEVSPFSFRTTMPWERESRRGLCGSRVTKLRIENGRSKKVITGVHVGSSRKGDNELDDIGYVAPAWQLKQMVEAYRNGQAPFALTCDGTVLFEMQVDEYIHKIVLFDEYNQELDTIKPALGLPSQRFFRNLLQAPLLHHVEFTLGRRSFADPHSSFIVNEPAVRKVSYVLPQE